MITFTTSNGNGTITLTYTAPLLKIQALAESAAYYLFEHGFGNHGTPDNPIEFDDLTDGQKLALIGEADKAALLAWARAGFIDSEITQARHDAEAQADIDFQL